MNQNNIHNKKQNFYKSKVTIGTIKRSSFLENLIN